MPHNAIAGKPAVAIESASIGASLTMTAGASLPKGCNMLPLGSCTGAKKTPYHALRRQRHLSQSGSAVLRAGAGRRIDDAGLAHRGWFLWQNRTYADARLNPNRVLETPSKAAQQLVRVSGKISHLSFLRCRSNQLTTKAAHIEYSICAAFVFLLFQFSHQVTETKMSLDKNRFYGANRRY